eukprot:g2999.t1
MSGCSEYVLDMTAAQFGAYKKCGKPKAEHATDAMRAPPSPAPLVDVQAAAKQFGSMAIARKMTQRFGTHMPQGVGKVVAACGAGDFAAVRAEAHSVKGACKFLAAGALAEAAQRVQDAVERARAVGGGRSADEDGGEALKAELVPLVAALERESRRALSFLREQGLV